MSADFLTKLARAAHRERKARDAANQARRDHRKAVAELRVLTDYLANDKGLRGGQ